MYVEAKPLSIYGATEGWKMPALSPSSTTWKRPPLRTASSSPAPAPTLDALRGMEKTIPTFQSFVERTPPADLHRPLPPTPLIPRRPSSLDSSLSRSPSYGLGRRSSSIYSPPASLWDSDVNDESPGYPSWRSVDFEDQDPLLRPIAYSASTPMLVEKPATQPESVQLLEPRIYSPLIVTPSPTASRATTPSLERQSPERPSFRAVEPRPSVLLPPPVGVVQIPKKHLRTVSLEKAKEMLAAPGAVHLLPEELRAQSLVRSRSQEPPRPSVQLRMDSYDMISGKDPGFQMAPTLVDSQGRERIVSTTVALPTFSLHGPKSPPLRSPMAAPGATFHVGKGPERTMASLLPQPGDEPRTKMKQALAHADAEENRGRTRTRVPRNRMDDRDIQEERDEDRSGDDLQSNAQKLAADYHKLLSAQYWQSSTSPASAESSNSDLGTHVKMVPQPLFTKPVPMVKGLGIKRRDSKASDTRGDGSPASHQQRQSSGSRGSIPMRLSSSLRGGQRTRSSERSLSTSLETRSPFEDTAASATESVSVPDLSPWSNVGKPAKSIQDSRASAFYPHIMPRKKAKTKAQNGHAKNESPTGQIAPLPLLAADIIAQRLKAPESTLDASPLRSAPPSSELDQLEDRASLHSQKSNKAIHKRLFKSAASKVGGRFRRKSSGTQSVRRPSGQNDKDPRYPVPQPTSPHLVLSPSLARSPPPIHLGWSDSAKIAFGEARASVQRPKGKHEPLVTHIQTPARPLDESKAALAEPESPKSPRGTLFGEFSLMDGWRENKAEKRRKDLKKLITVMTPGGEGRKSNDDGGGGPRPPIVSRR